MKEDAPEVPWIYVGLSLCVGS